jgi:hypothetical protein
MQIHELEIDQLDSLLLDLTEHVLSGLDHD